MSSIVRICRYCHTDCLQAVDTSFCVKPNEDNPYGCRGNREQEDIYPVFLSVIAAIQGIKSVQIGKGFVMMDIFCVITQMIYIPYMQISFCINMLSTVLILQNNLSYYYKISIYLVIFREVVSEVQEELLIFRIVD